MLLWLVSVAEMKELTNSVRLITKDPDMFFCGADHRSRFAKLQKKEIIHSGSTASFAASLYLLTASSFLWNEISPIVCGGRIERIANYKYPYEYIERDFQLNREINGAKLKMLED